MARCIGLSSGSCWPKARRHRSRTDGIGGTLTWTHDERGNRLTQANRVGSPSVAVTWAYDKADRMTSRVADSATTSYTWNANGQMLTATNSIGTITVTYDRLGRQLTVDPDDGSTTNTWTYTSFTSEQRVDVTGTTIATLDRFGRETSLATPMTADPFTFTYRADPVNHWDPDGRLPAPYSRWKKDTSPGWDRWDLATPSSEYAVGAGTTFLCIAVGFLASPIVGGSCSFVQFIAMDWAFSGDKRLEGGKVNFQNIKRIETWYAEGPRLQVKKVHRYGSSWVALDAEANQLGSDATYDPKPDHQFVFQFYTTQRSDWLKCRDDRSRSNISDACSRAIGGKSWWWSNNRSSATSGTWGDWRDV